INNKITSLTQAVEKADDERKKLQRKACTVFEVEFAIDSWAEIEILRKFSDEVREIKEELTTLEESSPINLARDRVADTFELLLKEFFSDKYIFDRNNFVLKRGDQVMARGPHRTLSDGEKTVIAFCYFIACIHRKVKANSEYRKLFLVFDDPVTSLSYDFVFSIAQILKNLNISDQGEVSTNPGKIDGNKSPKPNLLVLTHSSYFFNILRTNKVVKPEATFTLHCDGNAHKLTHISNYVAPFEQQLDHVFMVANGSDPNHGTGNAIRSVLEAIGRFCRPDKSQSLQDFITFLADEIGLSLKSILINSLCHGTYYDETPTPDDLKLACKETLSVVEYYAVGHIELIKSKTGKD
ncbi:MAG: AAA family ATPase, partial [Rhodobacteraceae bacterium]|nr:AAA family ATPase [Paracoccaceae bacterium]